MAAGGAEDLIESIRRKLVEVREPYQRSIDQTSELVCPVCYDLRGAWNEALEALEACADVLIAELQSGDPARIGEAYEPFPEAVREEVVAQISFVRHLDDHVKGKRIRT